MWHVRIYRDGKLTTHMTYLTRSEAAKVATAKRNVLGRRDGSGRTIRVTLATR